MGAFLHGAYPANGTAKTFILAQIAIVRKVQWPFGTSFANILAGSEAGHNLLCAGRGHARLTHHLSCLPDQRDVPPLRLA
jgi:hypothetical protein